MKLKSLQNSMRLLRCCFFLSIYRTWFAPKIVNCRSSNVAVCTPLFWFSSWWLAIWLLFQLFLNIAKRYDIFSYSVNFLITRHRNGTGALLKIISINRKLELWKVLIMENLSNGKFGLRPEKVKTGNVKNKWLNLTQWVVHVV